MSTKNTDKIEVSKIEIKIGGKVISLTLAEAKELRDILDETFPKASPVTIIRDHYYPRPYYAPIWVSQPSTNPYKQWEITCGDAGMNTSGYSTPTSSVMCLSTTSAAA